MATTIKLKNSVTTTAAPSTLVQGEVAVNVTDKKVWVGNAASSPVQILGAGATVSGTDATFTGNVTLGDASGDALTINSSAVSIPNGLNFDSNTLVIDATNNRVGIGTASPASVLHAYGSGQIGIIESSGDLSAGGSGFIRFKGSNGNSGYIGFGGTANAYTMSTNLASGFLTFETGGGTERMRIDSSGNVGIGTSSPGNKLEITGDVKINAASNGTRNLYFGPASGNYAKLTYDDSAGTLNVGTIYAYPLLFSSNNTERMRIDSSGNVGIGTSSPKSNSGYTTLTLNNASNGGVLEFTNNGTTINQIYNDASGAYIATASGKYLQLNAAGSTYISASTNGSERMRIDSSGNLLVGTTSAINSGRRLQVKATSGLNCGAFQVANNGDGCLEFYNSSGTFVASIQVNSNSVAYNTSSDYRLKENIAPMTGALATVAQLKPVTYTWKADGSDGQGFIAHELQAVVPDCVTGEKDAVDADGKPVYQGIDTSFLVATLTAAIQEQQAIITDLKARIETLESK